MKKNNRSSDSTAVPHDVTISQGPFSSKSIAPNRFKIFFILFFYIKAIFFKSDVLLIPFVRSSSSEEANANLGLQLASPKTESFTATFFAVDILKKQEENWKYNRMNKEKKGERERNSPSNRL